MPVLQAICKLACVTAPVLPLVLAKALGLALRILAHVAIAVRKEVRTVAFSEALVPLALVLVSVGKNVDAVALCLRAHPLADVGLAISALPDAVAVLDALKPLAVVYFSVLPLIHAFPIWLATFVGPMIGVSAGEDLVAAAISLILAPLTLVDTPVLVDKHAETLSLPRLGVELAAVDAVTILLDAKVALLAHVFVVELIAYHCVMLNRITLILELAVCLAGWPEALLDKLIPNSLRHLGLSSLFDALRHGGCGLRQESIDQRDALFLRVFWLGRGSVGALRRAKAHPFGLKRVLGLALCSLRHAIVHDFLYRLYLVGCGHEVLLSLCHRRRFGRLLFVRFGGGSGLPRDRLPVSLLLQGLGKDVGSAEGIWLALKLAHDTRH